MALHRIIKQYPTVAATLAAPIDIETPRKNFDQARKIAEQTIEELKKKVKDDLTDFANQYYNVEFEREQGDRGPRDEYKFRGKEKTVEDIHRLGVEVLDGKPAKPKEPKGHDEGGVILYSITPNKHSLAPDIRYESMGQRREQYKNIFIQIGFSWEETQDPNKPKVFWWSGTPSTSQDKWALDQKHEYKDYADIERYMNKKLNLDEIIRNTEKEHVAGIEQKVKHLLEEVRNILKPLTEKSFKFANFPEPVTPELHEGANMDEDGDQVWKFTVQANPRKRGYEPFKMLYTYVRVYGGKFHTPRPLEKMKVAMMYFDSSLELKGWTQDDADNGDIEIDITNPDFSKLKELVKEVQQKMKRQIPVLEVDDDVIERAQHKFKVGQRIEVTNEEVRDDNELGDGFGTIEELTEDDGTATYTAKFDNGKVFKHLYPGEFIAADKKPAKKPA